MKIVIRIIFLVFISFLMQCALPNLKVKKDSTLVKKPAFYDLGWEPNTKLSKGHLPIFIETDTVGRQQLFVLSNNNTPVLYSAQITTPVCADGDCKLMNITLYWTLLGDYAGFDTDENRPLTKHDHDEFLPEDYLKLHQLLLDNNSILKNRTIDELVTSPKQLQLEGIDALSGATITEVKESVVHGALYSCYVAWHLVHNSGVKEKIKTHTASMESTALRVALLYEDNTEYQLYALERLSLEQYTNHFKRISAVYKTSIPLVRSLIIKRMPVTFWRTSELQYEFWNSFSEVDVNTRSLLLKHLNEVPIQVLESLSEELPIMTKNQLKVYLGAIETHHTQIHNTIKVFANSEHNTYSYIAKEFLERQE